MNSAFPTSHGGHPFIKALKDYKKIYISNDACDFFNSFISNNKIRVDNNIGVTNTVWLLIGYSSNQFSIESFLEKIDKDILCEIKNIINNHKSVIKSAYLLWQIIK